MGTKNFKSEKRYLEQIRLVGERIDEIKLKLLDPLLAHAVKKELQETLKKQEKLLHSLQKLVQRFLDQ